MTSSTLSSRALNQWLNHSACWSVMLVCIGSSSWGGHQVMVFDRTPPTVTHTCVAGEAAVAGAGVAGGCCRPLPSADVRAAGCRTAAVARVAVPRCTAVFGAKPGGVDVRRRRTATCCSRRLALRRRRPWLTLTSRRRLRRCAPRPSRSTAPQPTALQARTRTRYVVPLSRPSTSCERPATFGRRRPGRCRPRSGRSACRWPPGADQLASIVRVAGADVEAADLVGAPHVVAESRALHGAAADVVAGPHLERVRRAVGQARP